MNMGLIILATKSVGHKEAMLAFLSSQGFKNVMAAESAEDVKKLLAGFDCSVCLIDMPIADEIGEDLALFVVNNYSCGVVAVVAAKQEEAFVQALEPSGIFVISKPINEKLFEKALRFCVASKQRYMNLEKDKKKLEVKIEELKIIDRAKLTLIEKLKMSEEQAHKHIEKQAMNLRISRRAVAESILKTYET
ncbi:MAG: ANTAR domain-containing protein [Clostridiaceae bacterium]|jgi:response regulator NasT|nr:ANTAR domain-containing protein [Clostridiaceae bacterium]